MTRFDKTILLACVIVLTIGCLCSADQTPVAPGDPVDYNDIAIYPERWNQLEDRPKLFPWVGDEIVFLTARADLDHKVVNRLLNRLDTGWLVYAELTGRRPAPFKQLAGKPTITAVPVGNLTCGYGCGYVGATGIEVTGFYNKDYAQLKARPKAMPHYYFYEMGRNFYTFDDRHSLFTTGYAVFMRYVCMDVLKCEDDDLQTRKTIEAAEGLFAKGDMDFFKGFTPIAGLDEKAPRLKDERGRWIQPSDQPVLYASAMLKLYRDCGGEEWLKRFYRQLAGCPNVDPKSDGAALGQSLNWLVSASCAAGKDLTPVFVDRWHLRLSPETRAALAAVAWADPNLSARTIVMDLASIAGS